jgi:hypothetical protein
VLVLLPITGLLRIVVSGRWEGARGFWRLRPSGGRRGAIANDRIGGKGLVLEAAVPPGDSRCSAYRWRPLARPLASS